MTTRKSRSWIDYLCPDEYHDQIEAVDLPGLWHKGIRGLIVDLDNTLVKYHQQEVNPELQEWFKRLEALGMKCCIVSNNHRLERIRHFADALQIQFVTKAGKKPRRRPFRTAMALLRTEPANTAVIGDQVFTDILGGRRAGLYTVLIQPRSPKEFIGTRVVRRLESGWVQYLVACGHLTLNTRNK